MSFRGSRGSSRGGRGGARGGFANRGGYDTVPDVVVGIFTN